MRRCRVACVKLARAILRAGLHGVAGAARRGIGLTGDAFSVHARSWTRLPVLAREQVGSAVEALETVAQRAARLLVGAEQDQRQAHAGVVCARIAALIAQARLAAGPHSTLAEQPLALILSRAGVGPFRGAGLT